MANTKPNVQEYKEPVMNPQIQASSNAPDEELVIPLDGKMVSSAHPTEVGKNFVSLVNMRYGDKHPEGVLGMTKINTAIMDATYFKARSAFQFTNDAYSENHLLVQAYNTGLTASHILDNETAIPSAGAFNATDVWTDSTGSSLGMFSTAPGGHMAYCNGVDSCIWGGYEARCAAFIKSTTLLVDSNEVPSNPIDVTEKLTNRKADSTNVVTIAGGSDPYVSLLLPCDSATTTITDTSGYAHTVTCVGSATGSAAQKRFGIGSLYCDAVGDYISIPAAPSLSFGSSAFTWDFWLYPSEHTQKTDLIRQYDDANNYFYFTADVTDNPTYERLILDVAPVTAWAVGATVSGVTSGVTCTVVYKISDLIYLISGRSGPFTLGEILWDGVTAAMQGAANPTVEDASGVYFQFKFYAKSAGGAIANYESTKIASSEDVWHHIELARTGSTVYLFLDGVPVTLTVTTALGSDTAMPTLTSVFTIGSSNEATASKNFFDEVRISKGIVRHTADFSGSLPATAYTTTTNYYLFGSTRPVTAIKFYVSTANDTANNLYARYYNGSTWAAITITSDTTRVSSKSFKQTGTVTWNSSGLTPQKRYLEGYYLYWYEFYIDGGSAVISHVTLNMPFQNIIDLWDGAFNVMSAAYKVASTTTDIVLNINEYSYQSLDDSTYAEIHGLVATTQYLEIGFTQKATGLFIAIPSGYENTTAGTTMIVSYWNGSSYESVGTIADGTSSSGISLSKSGVVSWTNSNVALEAMKSVEGGFPLYYYKISFDQNLAGVGTSCRIYYTASIPTANQVSSYTFPIHAADRLMLGCEKAGDRNAMLISAQNAPDVFNGLDSFKIKFGDNNDLTCGCTIFAQYSANVYNFVIVFKKNETWSLSWQESTSGILWNRYKISPTVGCPSPMTLKVASVAFDKNVNQTKVLAVWRGAQGIYVTNGQAPLCVSDDINDVFDQSSDTHVNLAMIEKEQGFIDTDSNEYHWLWASNSNTTLDKEYVLDLTNWQWFEIDRGTGNRLQCGVNVVDTYGNEYAYGFIDTGYMMRTENGTDFDGTDITCTMHFGDQVLAPSNLFYFTELRKINLIAVSKTTDTDVTLTHYLDGNSTGSSYTLSTADAVHSYCNYVADVYSNPAIFHGFKLEVTSDESTKGFNLYF
jgi:hypothetical protein